MCSSGFFFLLVFFLGEAAVSVCVYMCVYVCVCEREREKKTHEIFVCLLLCIFIFFLLFFLSLMPSDEIQYPSIFRFFVSNETVNKDASKQNLLEIFKKSIL